MEKIHYFRPLYLALALTISLFSTASTPNRYKTSASLPDSLLTEQHIRSIYYTLPDSALSLLDEAEARRLLEIENASLILPAYEQVLKAGHTFNMLDARGAISVTERATYIGRIRNLSRIVAQNLSKAAKPWAIR